MHSLKSIFVLAIGGLLLLSGRAECQNSGAVKGSIEELRILNRTNIGNSRAYHRERERIAREAKIAAQEKALAELRSGELKNINGIKVIQVVDANNAVIDWKGDTFWLVYPTATWIDNMELKEVLFLKAGGTKTYLTNNGKMTVSLLRKPTKEELEDRQKRIAAQSVAEAAQRAAEVEQKRLEREESEKRHKTALERYSKIQFGDQLVDIKLRNERFVTRKARLVGVADGKLIFESKHHIVRVDRETLHADILAQYAAPLETIEGIETETQIECKEFFSFPARGDLKEYAKGGEALSVTIYKKSKEEIQAFK